MPIYWSLKSIPELSDLPCAERDRVWRRCWAKPFGHWQSWAALVTAVLCGAGGAAAGAQFESVLSAGLGGGLGGAIGVFIFGQVEANVARPYLRTAREADQIKLPPDAEPGPAPDRRGK